MFQRISPVFLLLLLLLFSAGAAQQPAAKVSYEDLLERVKKQDPAVDFKELRLAYTETKLYSPYGSDREARGAMLSALKTKDYDKALEKSEAILKTNYLDLIAHYSAL